MLGGDLKLADGPAVGKWIRPRLHGEVGGVADLVPEGFEAYARVLHPASDQEGNPVRWAAVADALGTTAHREMQWHALVGSSDPDGLVDSGWKGRVPSVGEMEAPDMDALCEVLAAHTAPGASCFFGLCTIQLWEEQFDARPHLLKLPLGRDYVVLSGPLEAVGQIVFDLTKSGASTISLAAYKGEGPLPEPDPSLFVRRQSPNLIWPEDCSWFVASEVDFDSTLVGGRAQLVDDIVGSAKLEAWKVGPTDSLTADADKVNPARRGDT
jgi:hypothetical protein